MIELVFIVLAVNAMIGTTADLIQDLREDNARAFVRISDGGSPSLEHGPCQCQRDDASDDRRDRDVSRYGDHR